MISVIFLTRRCPRDCEYCSIRDAKNIGPELGVSQWKKAFAILEEMGVDFNLILGNEPWLLGENLTEIMKDVHIPTGVYTTCPEPIFSGYRDSIFSVVSNLSCGIDWPLFYLKNRPVFEHTEAKALDAWSGMLWVKQNRPDVECHASITVHKHNYRYLPIIAKELTQLGVFFAVNFIHWNLDGGFDFFPEKEEIQHLIIPPEEYPEVEKTLELIIADPGLTQNLEMLKTPIEQAINMGWHCEGNPYEGPTIDSDGSLRVCGYRKGKRTSQFTIFDLPEKKEEWKKAVYLDAKECPGCFWPCPWMYHHMEKDIGIGVFTKHAAKHIPQELWTKQEERGKE